jgi:outer membrane autotransporter protein
MGQAANQINGISGDTGQSLQIGTAQLNDALQAVNGEELQAPQQQIVEVQDTLISSLTARIDAIRTGTVGPGLSLSGLDLSDGGKLLASNDLADAKMVPAQWTEGTFLSRLGVFANGKVILGDKDDTSASDGYDFQTTGVTAGVDYRLTDAFVLGAAFGYSYYNVDFNNTSRSPNGQDLNSDNYAFSLFGTYTFDSGLFTDAIGTVGWANFDSKRKVFIANNNPNNVFNGNDIVRTAKGDFDALQYGIAARVGYDYRPAQVEGLTVTPIGGIEYIRAEFDGFSENGANGLDLKFDDFNADSLSSNLGLEATYSISTGIGIITPGINGRWVHEFADDSGPDVVYANDPTGLSEFTVTSDDVTRNYGVLGASVAAQFARGWAVFVDYAAPVGLDNFTVHQINFGLRKDF